MNQINQNNFTFESENLVVDWISFKFQDLDNPTMIQIANYLFNIGFNSYQQSGKLADPIREPILVNSKNEFEVYFVGDNSYWGGTLLHFSGLNATRFYFFSKEQLIDWTIFSSGVLSRFDLYYSRENNKDDKISVQDFLHECLKELKQTNTNVGFDKNSKGLILTIGNRGSNLFYRIYNGKNFLKFEHEMKGKFLQEYHVLLVESRLEEFEQQLSSHFFCYSAKKLPLHYSYLDWLVVKLRPIRKQQIPENYLNVHYLQLIPGIDRKNFFNFLQFLVYAQSLDYEIDSLGTTYYRQVVFRVQDFLKYQNPTVKPTNYYQLKKLIDFLNQLQNNSLIQFFSDTKYRSLVTIPEVNLEKDKQNSWIAKVWIAEELFSYIHPFLLPSFSKQRITKDQFEVQFKVIQVFSSINLEKKFFIKEFLDSYPAVLSNQRITKIKELFLQFVGFLKEHDLIESNYKIISDGYYHSVQQLNTHNISEGFILYEKLSI